MPTWNFTVAAEMYRRCPMAALLSPPASKVRISLSLGVMSLAAVLGHWLAYIQRTTTLALRESKALSPR